MNLRPRRREEPEINLVPMIDVVLVLLIFFMIATSLPHQSALAIHLPDASAKPLLGDIAHIQVDIDGTGRYAINGLVLERTDAGLLKERLQAALSERRLPLIISADGKAPHQAVVTALDVAAQLGIQQLAIATVNESGSPQPATQAKTIPVPDF